MTSFPNAVVAGFVVLLTLLAAPVRAADREDDLLVYGGTSGGVTAAVQAARMGKRVVLVEPTKHLGGLSSGGLGMTDMGNPNVVGGLARDFYGRVCRHYE